MLNMFKIIFELFILFDAVKLKDCRLFDKLKNINIVGFR